MCCRANKRIISFSCLLCMLALFNALFIPLHLEDRILQHPDTALMHAAGRLPDWQDAKALQDMHQGLRNGSMKLGQSFVVKQAAAADASKSNSTGDSHITAQITKQLPTAAAAPEFGSLQADKQWAVDAVGMLAERVQLYQAAGRACPDVLRLRRNLLKHHEEIFRMQVGVCVALCWHLDSSSCLTVRGSSTKGCQMCLLSKHIFQAAAVYDSGSLC
jgi:hypothetical protein